MRDITLGDTIYISFTTRAFATGVPTVLAGTPVVSAYEDASVTQITAGITLTVSLDSVVGFNMLTIVATGGNGFELGKDYQLVITTGTVGGVSVVGEVVGSFQVARSAAAVDLANGTDGLTVLKASLDDVPTVAEFNARTIVSADYFDPAADTVLNVTTVATLTGHTVQTGDSFARIGATGSGLTSIAQASEVTSVRMATLTDWINGGRLDLLLDAIKAITDQFVFTLANHVDANALAINGQVEAAQDLERSARTVIRFAAIAGTLSTTQMTTDITISVADQLNGRIIIWATDTTTAALRNQATDITDTEITNGRLTFTGVTTVPVAGDTGVIV